ncbi:branched-chain amino acid ABC transporter permease [Funiculus sociatus GB2-A5]|jgi:ABC-type branched-subunit amino acid transport system permease subunit|uniref:Branched-chain amino acid ABC transporter permease n=1 Tax=Funiculus sociatus GB2-A5 TaxID=2933946 RepID=A0ABV0JMK8_9CYAN|nr:MULTISPECIES: branched-chain amino acid ABC transporter permease [unclassified Trichocoleus]MBD1905811.1 branched-chain amino acid ABC transporter permease [Trichocoleus sp. FACHB-832]MBD1930837.1 branched-chain amino acid ABC transporter permease [Trichocoleus sp. FACHB-69]MBD2004761.1 branched-chain amino acid ABC transporter permease [Trichocoleus sp. FACHB-40]MBD2065370.1 branched-chain amino acid ABC transporter permease [Trichocoleus sp. FACHB-6]
MIGYLIFLVTFTATFALFSLGLNLQWGFTGLINFGHVAFMTVGAYTTVLLSMKGVPLIFAVLIGAAVAALLGLLIGLSTLRLREDYLAIVTIGVAELLRLVALNEEELTFGSFGVQARTSVGRSGYALPLDSLPLDLNIGLMVLSLLVLGLTFWLLERLVRSPWGRVLKAIREDEQIPKALGKNVFWYKLQAFMLGGAIAGVAGSFYAWYLKTVYPTNFEPLITFNAWTIVVLGGAGSNLGTILGAIIFSAYFEATRFILPGLVNLDSARLGALRIMLIGLILMLLMIWRPQGILGKKEELTLGK